MVVSRKNAEKYSCMGQLRSVPLTVKRAAVLVVKGKLLFGRAWDKARRVSYH